MEYGISPNVLLRIGSAQGFIKPDKAMRTHMLSSSQVMNGKFLCTVRPVGGQGLSGWQESPQPCRSRNCGERWKCPERRHLGNRWGTVICHWIERCTFITRADFEFSLESLTATLRTTVCNQMQTVPYARSHDDRLPRQPSRQTGSRRIVLCVSY